MKKLVTLLMAFAVANVAFADNYGNKTMPMQNVKSVEGSTIITNLTKQKVKVQWQTSLSNSIKSPVQSQLIPPMTKKFNSSEEVEWFEDVSKDAANDLIYMLNIKVFDVGGSLLSDEDVKITRSYESMTGDNAKNNLHIIINKNYTIDYSLI